MYSQWFGPPPKPDDERESLTAATIAARISESSTAVHRSVVAIAIISARKQGAMLRANQRLRVPAQQTPEADGEQDRGTTIAGTQDPPSDNA